MSDKQLVDSLLEAIKERGLKHDASGTPTAVYGHGQDATQRGLFTFPGVAPEVFSTIVGTEPGMIGVLPKYPSVYTNPTYFSITGIQADIGSEPSTVCGAAPTAGYMKGCKLTSPFGRFRRQTREIYLDRIGARVDLSDPDYLQLMNNPIGGNDPILNPSPFGGNNPLTNEIAKVTIEMGFSINNLLNRQLWIGSPANNNGEAYKEFAGFDLLVAANQVDCETNTACPSLYSDIKDFAYGRVDAASSAIIDYLTYLTRYTGKLARSTGLDPVTWVFAMREELFYEISQIWACRYYTYRCQSNADTGGLDPVGSFDSAAAVTLRDDMRNGRYLIIDGKKFPVVFDDGIPEEDSTDTGNLADGCFASDIYLIPLTVLGGKPVTFMEYFDHTNKDLATALGEGKLANTVGVTNNGAWIWVVYQTGLCAFWQWKVEPRVVLRTPQLAGKITNVAYCPLQHTRQPFPEDGYFKNGGITHEDNPTRYAGWNQ